jgi:protease I
MKKKIAMLLTREFEDSEVEVPYKAFTEAGHEVTTVAPEAGVIYEGKRGRFRIKSDLAVKEASPEAFDALFLPGGRSPEYLRLVEGAVDFVKAFTDAGKPVAAICHGPQLLISAGALRGRTVTCYDSIVVDVENAGATYRNQPVVVDANYVTARKPEDLPAFCQAVLEMLARTPAAVGQESSRG